MQHRARPHLSRRQALAAAVLVVAGSVFVGVGRQAQPAGAASDIAFVGASDANGNTPTETVTVPAPVSTGDSLLLIATGALSGTISAPSGWTPVGTESGNGVMVTSVWSKAATAADLGSSVTVTFSTTSRHGGVQLLAYSGTSVTSPVLAFATNSGHVTTSSATTPTVSVAESGCLVVSGWATKSSTVNAWTAPTGQTVRDSVLGSGSGRVDMLATDYGTAVSPGTAGGLTASTDQAFAADTTFTLVLAPASQGPVTPSAAQPCNTGITPVPIQHVIVIVEENETESKLIGNPSAPYLNSLADQCGLAANYHNTDHPSTPNYIDLTSGTVNGAAYSKDCNYPNCAQAQENIFDELTAAGLSWQGYAESMPANCDNLDTTLYTQRHNPPVFYSDLHNSSSTSCANLDVPLVSASSTSGGPTVVQGNFYDAVVNDTLPSLAWIAPNLCDDGHSYISGYSYCTSNRIANMDNWLAAWVPFILNSPEYAAGNTELMVLFDEGTGTDTTKPEACWDATHSSTSLYPSCWTTALFVGPNTPLVASTAWFNHFNVLNALTSIFGVPALPGNSTTGTATPNDLRATFNF